MMKKEIEPFIILPYGNMQDMLFYIEESIREEYHFLIEMAYRKLANEIIERNIIRVINKINEVVIFHIYPTVYKEKDSNRGGQCLVIGFIINKKSFFRKYNNLVYACNLFFETVMECGCDSRQSLSIPSQFLIKVNQGYYNKYIQKRFNETHTQMIFIMQKGDNILFAHTNKRLKMVYDFIKSKRMSFREYWILTGSENIDYYKKFCKVYSICFED